MPNDADWLAQERLEGQWLQEIASRSSQAAAAAKHLFLAYDAKLKSRFRRLGMAIDDIRDLVQEVFLKVWRSAHQFIPGSSPSAWIRRIAINTFYDWAGGGTRPKSVPLPDLESHDLPRALIPLATHPRSVEINACVQRKFRAFQAEYPDGAELLWLREGEGWSIEDLFKLGGRASLEATRTYLSEMRKKVRVYLKPCYDMLSE